MSYCWGDAAVERWVNESEKGEPGRAFCSSPKPSGCLTFDREEPADVYRFHHARTANTSKSYWNELSIRILSKKTATKQTGYEKKKKKDFIRIIYSQDQRQSVWIFLRVCYRQSHNDAPGTPDLWPLLVHIVPSLWASSAVKRLPLPLYC